MCYLKCLSFQILSITPVSPRVSHSPSSCTLQQANQREWKIKLLKKLHLLHLINHKNIIQKVTAAWVLLTLWHISRNEKTPWSSAELSSLQSAMKYHQRSFQFLKAVKKNTWMTLHGTSTSLAATAHYYPTANYSTDNTKL